MSFLKCPFELFKLGWCKSCSNPALFSFFCQAAKTSGIVMWQMTWMMMMTRIYFIRKTSCNVFKILKWAFYILRYFAIICLTSVISFNNYIFIGSKDLLLIDMTLFHLLLPHKIATCKLVFFIVVMGGIIDDFVNERQMALDFGFAL